jgi:protein SCO1/2
VAAPELPALLAQGGGVTIVDFIYTRCQTVCLSLGSSFQQLQAALLADARRASPAACACCRSASTARTTGRAARLRPGPAGRPGAVALRARARRGAAAGLLRRLGVVVVPDGRGDYEHNAALLVFDARGRMVRVFDVAEQQLALDYARHLARQGETAGPAAPRPGPLGAALCVLLAWPRCAMRWKPACGATWCCSFRC